MSSNQSSYHFPDHNHYYESGSSAAQQPPYSQRSLPPASTASDQSNDSSHPHQSSSSVGNLMAGQDEEYINYSHPHYSLPSTSLQGSLVGPDATYTDDAFPYSFVNMFNDCTFDTEHSQRLADYSFLPTNDYHGQLFLDDPYRMGDGPASTLSGYSAHDMHTPQIPLSPDLCANSTQPLSLDPVSRADGTASRPTAMIELPHADIHSHSVAVVASSSNPTSVPEVPGPSCPHPSPPAPKRLMPLTADEDFSTERRVLARHDGARNVHSASPSSHRRSRSNPNILGRGLGIPQERYKTNGVAAYNTSEQHPPITFNLINPDQIGIPVMDILNRTEVFARMQGRTQAFNHMGKKTFTLRVLWPGYEPWSKTIAAMDWKKSRAPITRVKLADAVAVGIRDLFGQYRDKSYDPDHAEWNVGPNGIQLNQICLVALHHVSKGSWQPQLCLRESPPN